MLLSTIYRLWYTKVTGKQLPPWAKPPTIGPAADAPVLMDADGYMPDLEVDEADEEPTPNAADGEGAANAAAPTEQEGTSA
jgi:hypothetical protein